MRFTAMSGEQEVYVDSGWDGKITFACHALPDKTFTSWEKLEAALRDYDLSLRKDFSNRKAYKVKSHYGGRPDEVAEVEVTSLVNAKEAWIKSADGRTKTSIANLFADREAVQEAINIEAESDKKVKAKWASLARWSPQK